MRGRIPSPLQSAWAFCGWVVVLVAPVWKLVSFAGNVDFIVNRADEIAAILNSLPGTLLLVAAGLVLLYYASYKERPQRSEEGATDVAPQVQRREQDAPISSRPEPPLGATDEPFSLEPAKRRGPPKSNGERDIYMSIRVTNKGSGQIRGCRGRLVRVQDLVSTPDGSEWRDIPHIHPAYLLWSSGDGGGDSADFTREATLDVAVIESWAEPVYQLLTANESLRPTYRLKYEYAGPILTVEISAQSGDRVEQTFNLDGHLRNLLEAPAEVEPMVKWRTYP